MHRLSFIISFAMFIHIFVWLQVASVTGCYQADGVFPDAAPGTSIEDCPMPALHLMYPFATPPPTTTAWLDAPSCAIGKYDVLIVLGCPSEETGGPSACQKARVRWALQLHEAGYGDRFIVTGGAVHNQHSEADSLNALLLEAGMDITSIYLEPLAEHTDENIYYSTQIMEAEGFRSALVVSSTSHLLYAAACDANCCVRLGRMSALRFPVDGGDVQAGHYILTPPAREVTGAECAHLENPSKLMCVNRTNRRACADNFALTP